MRCGEVAMGLGLRQGLSCRTSLECSICGCYDGHDESCPMGLLERLEERHPFIQCPACSGSKGLMKNASDWLECRDCHTQFSLSGQPVDESQCSWLVIAGEERRAFKLTEKGKGDFPYDRRMEDLRKQIKESRKRRRR